MNDREEIAELVALYADGVNRNDMEAWSTIWSEDANYSLMDGMKKKGRDAIVALFVKVMESVESMVQLVHNGTIELDGDSATGRWYVSEQQGLGEGKNFFVIGVYQDRYVRTSEGWKFAERHLDLLYREPRSGEMGGTAFPFPVSKV